MNQLFHLFFDICLLRKGPQDVPSSGFLLGVVTFINTAMAVLGSTVVSTFSSAILQSLVGLVLFAVLLFIVLQLSGHMARYQQTFIAVMGIEILFHFLMLPISVLLVSSSETDASAQLTAIIWLILVIWYLVVTAHILRHAIDIKLFFALMLSLGFFMSVWQVTDWLVG